MAIQPIRNEWNSERCQKRSFSFTFSNCINFIHFGTYTFYALFILSIICNGLIHYGIMYNVGHRYWPTFYPVKGASISKNVYGANCLIVVLFLRDLST